MNTDVDAEVLSTPESRCQDWYLNEPETYEWLLYTEVLPFKAFTVKKLDKFG